MSEAASVPAQADNTQQPQGGSMLSQLATTPGAQPAAPAAPQTPEAPRAPAATSGTWRDKLPDELKGHQSLSKFDTEEGLAKSYVNLERMLGSDKIPIPKDPEDKDGWDRYYAAGGRPAKADEYAYEAPKDLPEGISFQEEKVKFVKEFAFQNGFNQRQFNNAMKEIYEDRVREVAAYQKAQGEARAEGERALQLTGNAEEIKTLAGATVRQYLDQDAIQRLESAGLGNDPVILRAFAKIGKDLTGHQVLKGKGGEVVRTGEQVKNDISEFRQKHTTALMDKQHPEHEARVKELNGMYQRLYPENAA